MSSCDRPTDRACDSFLFLLSEFLDWDATGGAPWAATVAAYAHRRARRVSPTRRTARGAGMRFRKRVDVAMRGHRHVDAADNDVAEVPPRRMFCVRDMWRRCSGAVAIRLRGSSVSVRDNCAHASSIQTLVGVGGSAMTTGIYFNNCSFHVATAADGTATDAVMTACIPALMGVRPASTYSMVVWLCVYAS